MSDPARAPSVRLWHTLVACFVTAVLMVAICITYTAHSRNQDDARWCELMSTLDEGYSAGTPTTPIGIKLRRDVKRLRADLGC